MKQLVPRLAPLLTVALLSTGCASLSLPSHDDLLVVTDPPGALATCGNAATVTPGSLRIRREKAPAVVRVELEGFEPRDVVLDRTFEMSAKPWGVGFGLAALGEWVRRNCDSVGAYECAGKANTATFVLAGVSLAGFAIDTTSRRARPLIRKEIVLRLDPVRLSEAQEGEPR